MQDPKVFNQALESVSAAYKAYAETKLKGWNDFTCESQQQKDFSFNSAISSTSHSNSTSKGQLPQQQQQQQQNTQGPQQYNRPRVILGTSDDYATHYEKYLNPKLKSSTCENESSSITPLSSSSPRHRLYFLDFGAAPGGMCKSLLQRWENSETGNKSEWYGTAVTLGPSEGGLPMDDDMLLQAKIFPATNTGDDKQQHNVAHNHQQEDSQVHFSSRLVVKYRDVCDADSFINSCTNHHHGDDNNKNDNWADFVNCGIVLDAKVKSKKTGKVIGYGEQLFIQLMAALKALKNNGEGDVMVALRFDFPSLPETIPTIDIFAKHSTKGVFILPTLYTESAGRKQFYLLARGIVLSEEFCHQVKNIWERGRERYVNFKKEIILAREAKKNVVVNNENNNIRQREDTEDGDDNGESKEQKEIAQVHEMVRMVHAACGPTLDEFCNIIQKFLERNFEKNV